MPTAEPQWEETRKGNGQRFRRKDGSVIYIFHCPIIGVSPWRDLETTRGWKGASTSPRVLFALPRSSLPTLDPSILVVVVASHRAFEKLISLPRLTRFLVRGRFLRGVVILC